MKTFIASSIIVLFFGIIFPAYAADNNRPTISTVTPTSSTVGASVAFTAFVSDDDSGIASCNLYIDNEDTGSMSVSSGISSKSYTFAQSGVFTVFVFCRDNSGNFNSGPSSGVFVTAAQGGDSTPPSVDTILPTSVSAGSTTIFNVPVSDTGTGIASCTLFEGFSSKGAMTVESGAAAIVVTLPNTGIYSWYAQCIDNAGNTSSGPITSIIVTEPSSSSPPQNTPVPTPVPVPPPLPIPKLIKLSCSASSTVNDPCKAVYYAANGKRHAFPNSKVYATWYKDFSDVQEVSLQTMASFPLGHSVTYRPGSKLVKFVTLNKVYAVARGGILRWIKSEDTARQLYGIDWNKKVDDISDVFYLEYQFGADINTTNDFSPEVEITKTPTIDVNFLP